MPALVASEGVVEDVTKTVEEKNETEEAVSEGPGSWTSAELVASVCDHLVASGKIRTTPAFIRTDREAKILKVFEAVKIDGAKLVSFSSARELEVTIRKGTEGESWVDDVVMATKTFLPEAALTAPAVVVESEDAKKAKEAYRQLCASRVESGYEGTDEQPNDRRRGGGDDEAFASFNGRGGGGGNRACYTCGETGHQQRECPQGGGGGRGDRDDGFGRRGGDEAFASFNGSRGGGGRGDRDDGYGR